MPRTSRPTRVFPIALRELEVVRVTDVTPGMRRVRLAGDQLDDFTAADGQRHRRFASPGFDDAVRLFFPYPGESEPILPVLKDGKVLPSKGRRPLMRVYSVRRWNPERRELDIDFVTHGVGVATTWAHRARPGDRVHMGGPSGSRGLPAAADRLLVVGDETALPAIGRLLEELGEDARGQVFIEVAREAHRQELRELPRVELTWLVRHGAEAGTTTLLLDAVRATDWSEGRPFAWVAGEQGVVRDVRRHLVEERGMPKEDVEFTGYWRRAAIVPLDGDDAVPDPEKSTAPADAFHDLAELIPPIAIRVAAELSIGDLISRGIDTVGELAERTGSDERALGKLLRYLRAIDLLHETATGRHRLTEVGEFLANELWIDALSPTGVVGRRSLGIHGLSESIRTGKPAYRSVTGQDFANVRADQSFEDTFLDHVAASQRFLAAPIADSGILDDVGHLVIHSDGAGAQAHAFTVAHPDLRVTICALPAQADWLRRDLPVTIPDHQQRARISVIEQSVFEPSPAADAVFLIGALAALPDADAAYALRRAAENLHVGGRVLLSESTFDTGDLDEHDAEADLLALTRDGSGLRTDAELAAVVDGAGLTRTTTHTVGWGARIHDLAPV